MTKDAVENPHPDLHISIDLNIEGDWHEDPLKLLFGLEKGAQNLQRWQRKGVAEARAQGKSWEAIGAALGVSRQAAWERFKDAAAEGSRD